MPEPADFIHNLNSGETNNSLSEYGTFVLLS